LTLGTAIAVQFRPYDYAAVTASASPKTTVVVSNIGRWSDLPFGRWEDVSPDWQTVRQMLRESL